MYQDFTVSSPPDTKNCATGLAVPAAGRGVSPYQVGGSRLPRLCRRPSFFRLAALTCSQMLAVIAMVTTASTAHSQCNTMSNDALIAPISFFLVGKVVFLSVAVLVASVLLALCIFHYVIDSRVRPQGDRA